MDTVSGETDAPGESSTPADSAGRDARVIAARLPTLSAWLSDLRSGLVPEREDRPTWGDGWAVLLLAAATIYLIVHDGGRPRGASLAPEGWLQQFAGIVPVLLVAVPVLLTSVREVSRDRPLTRWLLLGWAVGPLIALSAAGIRDGWVRSLAAYALAVPLFLAARRVWRATWGPPVLALIVVLAGLTAWGSGLLLWMSSMNTRHWPLLSWHNQTATFMGVVFLAGTAIAWTSRRWIRGAGVLVAVLGASGLWLAASRGAFLLTLVALGAGLSVVLRSPHARAALPVTALIMALTVPTVLLVAEARVAAPSTSVAEGEAASEESGSERALLDRGTDTDNLEMRFDYWNGALAMFRSAPMTGTGPGSFPWAAPPHLEPDYFPTLSTHNEYLEVLGTMGLVGALPVWGATLGMAWLVMLVLRRSRLNSRAEPEHDPLDASRWAGRIAAVGSLSLLGLHAGMDLDWLWPLLLGAAAIVGGVLHADVIDVRDPSPSGRGIGIVTVAASLVLAVVVASGAVAQRVGAPPWDLGYATSQVIRALQGGEVSDARQWRDSLERWNPDSYDAAMIDALINSVSGDGATQEVAASIHPRGVRFPVQVQVASLLLDEGEVDAAADVLQQLRPHLADRPPGEEPGRQASYVLELAIHEARGGCASVVEHWEEELRARIGRDGLDPLRVARTWGQRSDSACPIR